MTSSSDDAEPVDDVDAWLERNAEVLLIRDAGGIEYWERAKQADPEDVKQLEKLGRVRLELPDGDPHELVAVKTGEDDLVGACDCDGFRFHSHPCAHLAAMAQLDALQSIIPVDRHRAEELAFSVDAEVIDQTEQTETAADKMGGDDVQEAQVVDVDESSQVSGDEPRGSDVENRPPTPSNRSNTPDTPRDAFAGELPDVDDQYVMELGGSTYIRRAGYARLARSEGFRLLLEEIVGAHENEWSHSKYRAEVLDEAGEVVASDVGTAHVDAEDLSDAEANLDELAATRAACRSLAWATGEGLNAVEEKTASEAQRAQEVGR